MTLWNWIFYVFVVVIVFIVVNDIMTMKTINDNDENAENDDNNKKIPGEIARVDTDSGVLFSYLLADTGSAPIA